jgi:mono/diheme cytochrome c family protein
VRAHVLGISLFIAFWVVVGLALFYVAVRGGFGGARAPGRAPSRGARKALGVFFAVIYLFFGVALPLVILTGNHSNANGQIGGTTLNSAEKQGRELFGEHCALCHTLAAANAIGKVGPNLDTLQPPASLVLNTINNGCVANPPPGSPQTCLGQGTMPAGILHGKDAQDVAAFVGKVAGKE